MSTNRCRRSDVQKFPTGASSAAELADGGSIGVSSNKQLREIFMTVLDPRALLKALRSWQKGDSGTIVDTQADTYTEDLGPSQTSSATVT